MPVLARMVGTPLSVDIHAGAIDALGPLLADRRISSGGHVAFVVGPGLGEELGAELSPGFENADLWTVEGGTLEGAMDLSRRLREGFYDALVGIGGGRTLDMAKHAATLSGLPMVAVATSLAHDGIASPVASLEDAGKKNSFGVQMPVAVVVDLDYVRRSPPAMRRSGVGDVISNLPAVADWHLARAERGEEVDGLAASLARTAAAAVLNADGGIEDDSFLGTLAESLVISGLSMAIAGSSRPCSGGEHEIVHAIDRLYPESANHGELAGVASLFTTHLRGDSQLLTGLDKCLRAHEMPRLPGDLGLSAEEFGRAVAHAPATRPDRYTVLEHLDLSPEAASEAVEKFVSEIGEGK